MTPAELPHVDEHTTLVQASRERVWIALLDVLATAFAPAPAALYARLVRCADSTSSGPRPLSVGSTVPGFRVTEAEHATRLVLEGQHRFSRYALVFTLRDADAGTLLSAESRALFPGPAGVLYRAAALRSGAHVLGVRRLLARVRRRAEQQV